MAKKASTSNARSGTGSRKTSTNKTSVKNTSAKKSSVRKPSASGKSAASKKKQEQGYTEPVLDDIKLIIVLAVCILILLSVFGLGGRVGDRAAYFLFGVFGLLAYALPFLLFIGIAFHMSNRGSRLAHIKLTAAVVFLMMIMALITLSDPAFDGVDVPLEGFFASAASREGGGLIGYSLSWLLFSAFGRVGTTVIFVCIMLIAGVLVTGKRLFIRLGHLIVSAFSALRIRFAAWQEARAEERLRREEELESEEDPDDDMDEASQGTEIIYRDRPFGRKKKKAANIVIAEDEQSRKTDENNEKDEKEAQGSLPTLENVLPSAEVPDMDKEKASPFTKEHLDSYDRGQPVQPLHIQVPEFMRGGKLHNSTMAGRPQVPVKETDISEDVNVKENDLPDEQAVTKTALTVDDLDLVIEGLEEEETREKTEESPYSGEDNPSEDELPDPESEAASVEPEFIPAGTAAAEDPVHEQKKEAPAAKKSNTKSPKEPSGGDEPLEIIEEEIEKYEFPPLELLEKGRSSGSQGSAASLKQTALKLQQTFDSFGVGVQVTNVSCGPSVTRYELQPDQGVKVSRIVSLADDIKLNLAVPDIRIEAPIPGKAAVGIEVPNTHKEMVHLRDLLESDKARNMKSKLAFAVGKDIGGQTVVADIEKMPHLLIAGATGSGKSVCINTIIMSILFRADPNEVKMIMIDPKVVELNVYNGLPHLLIPVVTDPKKAAGALNWAVSTMMERYNKFAEIGAKDIKSYNSRVENVPYDSERHKKMPQIVIIIDELADLMMVAQSEVEDAICRLAQLARAAGIHLVIATQRPSVNVITGLIKANVPSRIAFSVSSGVDSRTILDMNGAEKLLGNGDMLFYPQGYQKPVRVQGAFVSENEIGRVTDYIRAHMSSQPVYNESIKQSMESSVTSVSASASNNNERDIYFEEAGKFVIEKEKASIGMLQRVYKIGFNRAARIMDQLCDAGVVGPEIGTKPRQIIMTIEEFEQFLKENQ
ncbi:MAG: DNA translocase FtsK 4TM domain-containing protein [Coprococcus sp.]